MKTPPVAVTAVLTTAPDVETGERLGRLAVDERLAACANVLPGITSIYRWNGEVRRDTEVLVILKTTVSAVPRLMDRISELHPYDVPELLALPVEVGTEAYRDWVCSEVGAAE